MSLFSSVARRIPLLWDMRTTAKIFVSGQREKRECPCCGNVAYFRLAGLPPRVDALCPNCQSRERHRLIHLFLSRNSDLYKGRDVLHFAPEPTLRRFFDGSVGRYVPCDYSPKSDEVFANIEALDFPDESFDLVICSHVLEHVDDTKALLELKRVLRPGGAALLLFPLIEGWEHTYENSSVKTERERYLAFGQKDHARFFGSDARDRMRAAGFELSEFTAVEPDVRKYGLMRGEKVFICKKSNSP